MGKKTKAIPMNYPGERIIHKSQDEHGHLVVTEGNMLRTLYFGNEKRQSAMFLQHSGLLVLDYSQVMMLALLFQRRPKRIFCLGLGGGSIVKFLHRACPGATIDVVELRERVIKIAHAFFDVPDDNPNIRIACADGAEYFGQSNGEPKYDLIFLDGYDHRGPVDSVSNIEYIRRAKSRLTPDGVLCINLWNRPNDGFHHRVRQLNHLFGGGVLRFELGRKNSNASVFCFNNKRMMQKLIRYEPQALELQKHFGINFHKFFTRLYRQNVPILKRLMRAEA